MFLCKIDETLKDLCNVFGIVDDILVVGYDSDGKDHDETLWQVIQICRNVNLKLNKDKFHFRCISIPFFGEVISRLGVQPEPLTCHHQKQKWSCRHSLVLLTI